MQGKIVFVTKETFYATSTSSRLVAAILFIVIIQIAETKAKALYLYLTFVMFERPLLLGLLNNLNIFSALLRLQKLKVNRHAA